MTKQYKSVSRNELHFGPLKSFVRTQHEIIQQLCCSNGSLVQIKSEIILTTEWGLNTNQFHLLNFFIPKFFFGCLGKRLQSQQKSAFEKKIFSPPLVRLRITLRNACFPLWPYLQLWNNNFPLFPFSPFVDRMCTVLHPLQRIHPLLLKQMRWRTLLTTHESWVTINFNESN